MEGTEEHSDATAPATVPALIKAGCYALMVLGFLSGLLSMPSLIDSAGTRCTIARAMIEDANDDDEEFNDVDAGEGDPEDIPCDEAIALADGILVDADEPDETRSVPGEAPIRVRGGISLAFSLGQAAAGMFTLRTLLRRARTAALVAAGGGLLLPVLGIITMGVSVFVFYALSFSAASKQIWPRLAGRRRRSRLGDEDEQAGNAS